MRVRSIKITEYRGLRNIELQLPTPAHARFGNLAVTLIVGKNGTGKTTLFRAMAHALTGRATPSDDITLVFDETATGDKREPTRVILSAYAASDGYKGLRRSPKSLATLHYAGTSHLTSRKELEAFREADLGCVIAEAFVGHDPRKKMAADRLLPLVGYAPIPYLLIDLKGLSSYYAALEKAPLDRHVDRTDRKQRDEFLARARRLAELASDKKRWPTTEERWLSLPAWKERFPDQVEWLLETLRMMNRLSARARHPLPFRIGFKRTDTVIPTEEFSTGERAMLYRFFSLMELMRDQALVLIDEPEVHLHPSWIQQFIPALIDAFSPYHAHLVLASHSPLIASDLPADCILILQRSDDQIRGRRLEEPSLGVDPKQVLYDAFELDDYIGGFAKAVIEDVEKALHDGDLPTAERSYRLLADSHEKYRLFLAMEKRRSELRRP